MTRKGDAERGLLALVFLVYPSITQTVFKFFQRKIFDGDYTLGPPLRIPNIKNIGRDLAPEELRICP